MDCTALIIHGGAGAREGAHASDERYRESLRRILSLAWEVLESSGARAAVLYAVRLLEDDPLFNAGLGSRLQSDGVARMSAAIMDGDAGRFSGVINVEAVRHPIDVADALGGERYRVLAGEHATRYSGSEAAEDDLIRLARRTEWDELAEGVYAGLGQRMLITDRDEYPLLEIRELVLANADSDS